MGRKAVAVLCVMGGVALVQGLVAAAEPEKPAGRLVQFAQPGTPEAVIQAALVAALEPDEDKGFQAYLALVHPSRKGQRVKRSGERRSGASRSIEQIRRYSWRRFRKQAPDYILPASTGGFTLARMDPVEILPSTRRVRLFIVPTNNPRRLSPPPMRLERSGKGWLITANSL